MLARVQEDAGAGQEDECRSAEVRDPASEEDAGRWAAGGHAGKDTHVIDRHQDHHRSSNQIYRFDSQFRRCFNLYWAGCHADAHDPLRKPERMRGAPS